MIIHTVQPGDTVYLLSKKYGVPQSRIIIDNDLPEPDRLIVGQSLAICFPQRVYTVKPGDSLFTIAKAFGTTVQKLYQNNPNLKGNSLIFPGQTLVISYRQNKPLGNISTLGYAYPYIDGETLRRTLPYLTYLSVFTHGIRSSGELISPAGDERVISTAKEYGTVPLMMLTSLSEDGIFSNELTTKILSSNELSQTVIDNAVAAMKQKGYGGIDADFEYISAPLAESYADFLDRLKDAMGEDYILFVSLAPKESSQMKGLLYEGHSYREVGEEADRVLLMTYEWGGAYSEPTAISPINKVRQVLDYAKGEIPPEKTFLGVPSYGYNWSLPYSAANAAASLSNTEAIKLALEKNAAIRYDEKSQAPFFTYFEVQDSPPVEHEVWFQDAKSYDALLRLAAEYSLDGVGIWNIMQYTPALWTVLNSLYNIRKK